MADYRVRLELRAPVATPFISGTIFGHLCWAYRHLHGEAALNAWLAALPEEPFLISDGFPAGCLPRPMLAPARRARQSPGEDRRAFTTRAEADKALGRLAWVELGDFLELRDGLDEPALLARLRRRRQERDEADGETPAGSTKRTVCDERRAHNTIDRRTGTTPESGGLYFVDERWHGAQASGIDVYVRCASGPEALAELFALVGTHGYGRDASLGRGQFEARVEPADPCLLAGPGNRRLSLSHGVLSANMERPRYRLHTHYGKLGGLHAASGRSPFKHPVLLTRPGATFTPADDGPFGTLLEGVHPHHPEIRHNAWHLAVPFTEKEPEP